MARSPVFALWTCRFPQKSGEVAEHAEWLMLLRTRLITQCSPQVMVTVTVEGSPRSCRALLAPSFCLWVRPCFICLVHMQPGNWFWGILPLWIRNHFVFLLFYLQEETHDTWNKRINAPLLWFMCRKDMWRAKICVWGFKGIIHPKNRRSAITHFHPNGKSSEVSSRA